MNPPPTGAHRCSAHRHPQAQARSLISPPADGRFKTLVAAVPAAGLVDTLKGAGPFTVFAPTDDAFAKLPAGTSKACSSLKTTDKLKNILTYHVVSGKVMAADVAKLTSAETVRPSCRSRSRWIWARCMINDAEVVAKPISRPPTA